MVVLAVGDEVDERLLGENLPEQFGGVRLILSCGDLAAEYLDALVDRFQAPLLYVRGNHDVRYRDAPPPGDNIHGRIVTVGGLRILGFEGSPWYNGEGIQYTERQMWWRVAAARPAVWRARGVDIVLTHTPPFGIHDGRDVCHTGFRIFRGLLEAYRPRYFVHGHNHLSYVPMASRVTVTGDTRVVNAFRSVIIPVAASVPVSA
ncbi:MAG TPA: metallophosphoesterase [bacterium]|nr:metallophosphoesterase [bacterium]